MWIQMISIVIIDVSRIIKSVASILEMGQDGDWAFDLNKAVCKHLPLEKIVARGLFGSELGKVSEK